MHGTREATPVARDSLALGDLAVRPSLRQLQGPAGTVTLEPRVMRVLLALADAEGGVVLRETLLERCWDGVFVGEDALSRAIGELRKGLREAGTAVTVETIPKAGYRLLRPEPAAAPVAPAAPGLPRRTLLLAGGAVAAAAAGTLAWRALRPDPQAAAVAALIEQGRDAWRLDLPDSNQQGIGFLEEAVAKGPANAEAWGLLALLRRNVVEMGDPAAAQQATLATEQAARRALALDPRQGDALAALAALPPVFGEWGAARVRLAGVLRQVPGQIAALSELGLLAFGTGRTDEAWRIAETVAASDGLSAMHQYRLVYRRWAVGRLAAMDAAADRGMKLWPAHPAVWFARMWTYGYTGRAEAALRMLGDAGARPDMPPPMLDVFGKTMTALAGRQPAAVGAAIAANLAAAAQAPGAAVMAVQHLAALGDLDAAFRVARGYLVRKGPAVGALRQTAAAVRLNDQFQRKTMMLFIPATAPMRADPRFLALAEEMGMAAYWRQSGLPPDFLQRPAPPRLPL